MPRVRCTLMLTVALVACESETTGLMGTDVSPADAESFDAGLLDASQVDAEPEDVLFADAGSDDAEPTDGTEDADIEDATTLDGAVPDADPADATVLDAGMLGRVLVDPESIVIDEGQVTFVMVRLSDPPMAELRVEISSSDPNRVSSDVGVLMFTPSNFATPQQIAVRSIDDSDCADDRVTFTLSAPDFVAAQLAVDVTDRGGQAQVGPGPFEVDEGASVDIAVNLSCMPSTSITVAVTGQPSGLIPSVTSLQFTPANYAQPQTVSVSAPVDDNCYDTQATLELTPTRGAARVVPFVLRDNDDCRPLVTPDSLIVPEGTVGAVFVSLAARPRGITNVTIQSSSPAVDVIPGLQLSPNEWNGPWPVQVRGVSDPDAEDETAVLTFDSGSGPPTQITVQVIDDEEQRLIVSPLQLTLTSPEVLSVRLAVPPVNTTAVTLRIADLSAAALSDVTLVFTAANFSIPQTVVVTPLSDADLDDEQTTITLTEQGSADVVIPVTVIDPDLPEIQVTPSALSILEGQTGTFTVRLSHPPTAPVSVFVTSSNFAKASMMPAVVAFTPTNFSNPQTVTLSANEDLDAADEQVTISASAAGYAAGSVAVTVIDNDVQRIVVDPPNLTFTVRTLGMATVRLAVPPSSPTTVSVTNLDPAVLTVSPPTLTFNPSNFNTPQTITVREVWDCDGFADEGTIEFNAPGVAPTSLRVFVNDTDDPSVRAIPGFLNIPEGGSAQLEVRVDCLVAPSNAVTLTAADPTAVTFQPTTLVFTSTTPQRQTVTVFGTTDGDTVDDMTTLWFQAPGYLFGSSVAVTVEE